MVGLLGQPAAAQQSRAFYCIDDVYNPPIQPFVVPQDISELQVLVQGAHGGTPRTATAVRAGSAAPSRQPLP